MLCWQDIVYTEVCDPRTMRRVPYGERGTPVYTHLERTSQPMIRLRLGRPDAVDRRAESLRPTYPRLPQGIFGRIDDMFTIRGENVYPSEIDAGLNELPELRRRASHSHQPRSDRWTSFCFGSKPMRRRYAEGRRRDLGVSRETRTQAAEGARACAPAWRSSRPAPSRAPTSRRGASSTIGKCFATCTRRLERSAGP